MGESNVIEKERRGTSKKVSNNYENITKAGNYNNRGKGKRSEGRGNRTEGGIVLWEKDTAAIQSLKLCFGIFLHIILFYILVMIWLNSF